MVLYYADREPHKYSHTHTLIMHEANVLNLKSTDTRCPRILPHFPYFHFLSFFLHPSRSLSLTLFRSFAHPSNSLNRQFIKYCTPSIQSYHMGLLGAISIEASEFLFERWISANGSLVKCDWVEILCKNAKIRGHFIELQMTYGLIDMCDGTHI